MLLISFKKMLAVDLKKKGLADKHVLLNPRGIVTGLIFLFGLVQFGSALIWSFMF